MEPKEPKPKDEQIAKLGPAERTYLVHHAAELYFRNGYLVPENFARDNNLTIELARQIVDTTVHMLQSVAMTGDATKVREILNRKLWELYETAQEHNSFDACTKMLELFAKVNGALVNRSEVTVKQDPIAKLTEAEKAYYIQYNVLPAEALEKLGREVPPGHPTLALPPAVAYQPIVPYLEGDIVEFDDETPAAG